MLRGAHECVLVCSAMQRDPLLLLAYGLSGKADVAGAAGALVRSLPMSNLLLVVKRGMQISLAPATCEGTQVHGRCSVAALYTLSLRR